MTEPEKSLLAHEQQWEAAHALWVEVLRRYLFDCKAVWKHPETLRKDPDEYEALNDLLSRDTPLLKHICHYIDANPEHIKKVFLRWIRNQ